MNRSDKMFRTLERSLDCQNERHRMQLHWTQLVDKDHVSFSHCSSDCYRADMLKVLQIHVIFPHSRAIPAVDACKDTSLMSHEIFKTEANSNSALADLL